MHAGPSSFYHFRQAWFPHILGPTLLQNPTFVPTFRGVDSESRDHILREIVLKEKLQKRASDALGLPWDSFVVPFTARWIYYAVNSVAPLEAHYSERSKKKISQRKLLRKYLRPGVVWLISFHEDLFHGVAIEPRFYSSEP